MSINCSIGNRVFLTLWTMTIRSSMVASFKQKMPSEVQTAYFTGPAGRLLIWYSVSAVLVIITACMSF